MFGRGKVEDFTWKGLLDFATCTECGRCQSQCPAWNTGKPLSPKLADHGPARPRVRQGAVPASAGRRHGRRRAGDGRRPTPSRRTACPRPASRASPLGRPGRAPADRHRRGGRRHRPGRAVVLHHLRRLRRAVPGRHRARRPHRRHAPLPGDDRVELPVRGRRDAAQPGEQGQPVGRCRRTPARTGPRSLDFEVRRVGRTRTWPTSSTCSGSAAPAPSRTGPRRPPGPSPSCCTRRASSSRSSATARPAPATRPAGSATSSCSRCSAQQNVETLNEASATRDDQRRSSRPARTASTRSANEYPQLGGNYEVVHHTQLLAAPGRRRAS